MTQIYFDVEKPLFLTYATVSGDDMFTAIPVDIDDTAVAFINDLNELITETRVLIDAGGTAEDANQGHAEYFSAGLRVLWENYSA